MEKITIAIADDYEVFRDGLKVGLSNDDALEIVIEADNGATLMESIASTIPDVVIMDLKMPVMDGLTATKLIVEKYPTIKILVVTMYEDDQFIVRMIANGAHGYLLKNAEPEEICTAIHAVVDNGFYFSDAISNNLLHQLMRDYKIKPSFKKDISLDDKEKSFFSLLKQSTDPGFFIADHKQKVEQLLIKTGAYNLTGLKMYAIENNLG